MSHAICFFSPFTQAIAGKVDSLKKMRKALIDCGVESEAVRSQTINDLEAMLWR